MTYSSVVCNPSGSRKTLKGDNRATIGIVAGGGRTDKPIIAALTTALKDPDSRVRRSAADALGNIGEKARAAIPELVEVFDEHGL